MLFTFALGYRYAPLGLTKTYFLLADNDIILLLYDSLPFSHGRRMEQETFLKKGDAGTS